MLIACRLASFSIWDKLINSHALHSVCFRFTNFFGLRDFIHLVNNLRRETKGRVQMLIQNEAARTELVLGGVQRNFNGHQQFDEVCKVFCNVS